MTAKCWNLERFVEAQDRGSIYAAAVAEMRAGEKRGHWMWFIFPQVAGLGRSETSRFFAIAGQAEAAAYLHHPILSQRLLEAVAAMRSWAGQRSAAAVLGEVDAVKFRSSMTLFSAVAEDSSDFGQALAAFYGGEPDLATLDLLWRM